MIKYYRDVAKELKETRLHLEKAAEALELVGKLDAAQQCKFLSYVYQMRAEEALEEARDWAQDNLKFEGMDE